MKINYVKLKNIRSYLDETVSFPDGSLLLSGDVGSGKSTVLFAVDFALFGTRSEGYIGEALLRHGKDSGSVELCFNLDDNVITIKRTLKRLRDSVSQGTGTLAVNGFEEELSATELNAKVLELLGYPSSRKESIFRYTVYTPQEQIKQIILSDERLDILRRVFGIDKYGRIKENASVFLTELRSIKRMHDALAKDLEKDLNEKEIKQTLYTEILKKFNEQKEILSNIDAKIREKTSQLEIIESQRNMINALRQKIAARNAEAVAKRARLGGIKRDIDEAEKKLKLSMVEIEKCLAVKKPAMTPSEINAKFSSLQANREILIAKKSSVSQEISKLESILMNGICAVCGQPVHDRESFVENIETKKFDKKRIEDDISQTDTIMHKLKAFQNDAIGYMAVAEKINHLNSMIAESQKNISRLEAERIVLSTDITDIDKELAELQTSVSMTGDIEDKYRKKREDINAINIEKIEASGILARLEQQHLDITDTLNRLAEEINKKQKNRSIVMRISTIENWLDSFFLMLMETIERHVMVTIQKEFNSFFQSWFGMLIEDESLNVRIDDEFSPLIEQNGYETAYENLSGGEKTAVALAYRLALSKVINSLIETIRTKDLLILDEPTDGFSTDQLDRIRYVLDELKMKQVIIVSHEPKIDTFVDNVIRISKQDHVSSVVY
ncbi:MAG: SMC family ATPase [Candidatus Aenigmatarchaeota archaeon]